MIAVFWVGYKPVINAQNLEPFNSLPSALEYAHLYIYWVRAYDRR
jgi:hypothetical protein